MGKLRTPHPPPARARPPSPLRCSSGARAVGQLAAPRPARGGQDYPAIPKHSNIRILQHSSVAGSLADSPLPHYHTLDREQGALHRCESPGFVAPSLEAPSLRCSSLGASSLVAPTLRPSSLGDSLPSISLPTENSIPCKTVRTKE